MDGASLQEAIALMMGALADEAGWISSIPGVPKEELAPDLEKLAERRRADKLPKVESYKNAGMSSPLTKSA